MEKEMKKEFTILAWWFTGLVGALFFLLIVLGFNFPETIKIAFSFIIEAAAISSIVMIAMILVCIIVTIIQSELLGIEIPSFYGRVLH